MRDIKVNKKNRKKKKSKMVFVIALIYILYLTFIMLSRMPLLAELWLDSEMEDSYEYQLSFYEDGRQTHYEVERYDQNMPGHINVNYFTNNNTLLIQALNIKNLTIDCRSMYEDECKEVFGMDSSDNTNYYKWYFMEKDHLKVHINTEYNFSHLEFKDTPMPHKIEVNNELLVANVDYFYTNSYGTIIAAVPSGHSYVDIYFKPQKKSSCPVAEFTVSDTTVEVFDLITFDASGSTDVDGRIINYYWDFGDGTFISGKQNVSYLYPRVGTYGVILTVKDNDKLINRAYETITVVPEKIEDGILKIQGMIPDQNVMEDSEPWDLELDTFESLLEMHNNPITWWVTGENSSLYTITGENSTTDTLTFTPVSNAYGDDKVTICLGDNRGIRDSQTIWVNITAVNDAPTIFGSPDLVVHYGEPYSFNFLPYVNDVETPNDELIITTSDSKHTEVLDGLIVKFMYPESMLDSTEYLIITVSDGEDISEDVIAVVISDDWVPILKKHLPNVRLKEGEIGYNYFDLDDYYSDPDGDALYYSFGYSHIEINIHSNHSVDFIAPNDWSGREIVTFRATDPAGAIAEDNIIVTIESINDAPEINGVPNIVVHYDELYQFDLIPYISDEDNTPDELKISTSERIRGEWIDSIETGYIIINPIDKLVLNINYPKSLLDQIILVNITVTDGESYSSQIISLWVTSNYPPELVEPLPDISFLEDTYNVNAIDLTKYFLDRDYDDLYYSYGDVNINVSINVDGTVDLSAEENWYGSELITFRATDPEPYYAIAEDTISIRVIPVNDPPKIDIIPTQEGELGDTWVIDLMEYIHDVDNNITELNITIEPNGVDCAISGTELVVYGTSAINKPVTLHVCDGDLNATQTILVVVTEPPTNEMDILFSNLLIVILVITITSILIIFYRNYKSYYVIEEIFLIHKGGDLICHKSREYDTQVDEDILSAMFTVVQEFIKDSFAKRATTDQDWALDELKLGENKILIDRGRFVYLTVIFSGSALAGRKLRKRTKITLTVLEKKYAPIFKKWSGNMNKVKGVDEKLIELLPEKKK